MIKTFKIPRQPRLNNKKQKGAILILFFFITLLIVSSIIVSRLNQNKESVTNTQIQNRENDIVALAQAQNALLGFATDYYWTVKHFMPGYLPCPNISDQIGQMESSCDGINVNSIGCLPWRSIGLPRLKDSSGNDLWYAVSGNYKYSATSPTDPVSQITPENIGQIKIKNDSDIIAVIISPNKLISAGQTVNCSGVKNFLVGKGILTATSDTDWTFNESFLPTVGFKLNKIDQNVYGVVSKYLSKWVGIRVQECLNTYINSNTDKRLPWLSKLEESLVGSIDYNDDTDQLTGHVPQILNKTFEKNNTLSSTWKIDSYGYTCFLEGSSNAAYSWNWKGWWEKWRETVFVIINQKYTPDVSQTTDTTLTVDGQPSTSNSKFIVIVGGRKLQHQARTTNTDKLDPKNYLEGINLTNFNAGSGNFISGNPTDNNIDSNDNFNDVVCNDVSCF
jgi:hypothetical protein